METYDIAQKLQDAVKELAIRCDGAIADDDRGFNSADTSFGHYISIVPADQWDNETCHIVHSMLSKYRCQLQSYGIDYTKLPKPQVEWEKKPSRSDVRKKMQVQATSIELQKELNSPERHNCDILHTYRKQMIAIRSSDGFSLYSPKNQRLIERIKEANYRHRKWTGSCWVIGGSSLELLPSIIEDFGFFISDQDMEFLTQKVEEIKIAKDARRLQPHVWLGDSKIITKTEYNPSLVLRMKNITGRVWAHIKGGPKDENYFPVTVEALQAVIQMATDFDLNLDPMVTDKLEELEQKTREMVEASVAAEADIEVANFGSDTLQLRPFQKGGIKYALDAKKTFIADEMGLGKTIQALGTIQKADAYPALVIVPKAVKLQWRDEAIRWLSDKTVSVISGSKKSRYDSDIVIINYDILKKHVAKLKEVEWKALILDESHYIKNQKAQRSKAVLELAKNAPIRLCLTGTPILNRPVELVNQLAFLDRLDEFGGAWQFMKRFCNAHQTRYGWDMSGASNLEELARRLRSSCYVRREKMDVATELPPIQRTIVPIEIERKRDYQKAQNNVITWMRAKKAEKEGTEFDSRAYTLEALAEIEGLKQLAVEHKFNNCVEWVKNFLDSDGKLVLFAHHRDIQKRLFDELSDYNPAKITGGDSDDVRERQVKKFWGDASCKVMVASMQAANFGINLQVASSVAFMEFGWHASIHDQAEARVHRIGTKAESVNAYWLKAEDTFDEDIIALIENKRQIVDAVNKSEELPENLDIVSWFEGLTERKVI